MMRQRKILQNVEGYVPGEQPTFPNIVKLNTNENPYPPSPKVVETLRGLDENAVRRYPDPVSLELRSALAAQYGYPGPEWVVVTNGMDELLAMAVRAFTDPNDRILSCYPTYTLYETLALLHGARPLLIDLDDDFLLTEQFFETAARLCFLPRPNSPSGVAVPVQDVDRFCRVFDGLVVIDEAYVDFADDNCIEFAKKFDNAIVTRTMSKSFSLAGMRVGFGFAQPDLVAELMKVKDSYNMSAASQAAGVAALGDKAWMEANVTRVRATRARLSDELIRFGFAVPPSQSNFVFAQRNGTPSARKIFELLRDRAIVVRYFNAWRLENALRITVGTDSEIDALLAALRDILT
ncbi:MAG TPA: histidinol-phosphate transaminase [Candidatus Bathyarchaeia archaeon]|nr:histidinol-phosphate transaminase [Candidatus Bathyarchaeia archaeon]